MSSMQVIENEYGQIGIDEDLVKDKFKENEEIFGSSLHPSRA
jgi:hypothetical protein